MHAGPVAVQEHAPRQLPEKGKGYLACLGSAAAMVAQPLHGSCRTEQVRRLHLTPLGKVCSLRI